jgi:hypothetical protein
MGSEFVLLKAHAFIIGHLLVLRIQKVVLKVLKAMVSESPWD